MSTYRSNEDHDEMGAIRHLCHVMRFFLPYITRILQTITLHEQADAGQRQPIRLSVCLYIQGEKVSSSKSQEAQSKEAKENNSKYLLI